MLRTDVPWYILVSLCLRKNSALATSLQPHSSSSSVRYSASNERRVLGHMLRPSSSDILVSLSNALVLHFSQNIS